MFEKEGKGEGMNLAGKFHIGLKKTILSKFSVSWMGILLNYYPTITKTKTKTKNTYLIMRFFFFFLLIAYGLVASSLVSYVDLSR